jgi:hypothetical protein
MSQVGGLPLSYAGWIPTLGILPEPSRDRKDRVASMVTAHLVYGVTLDRLLGERA